MKKTLFLLAALFCLSLSSQAGTYPLYVGGTQVTDDNAADVLGDSTVTYNPETQTLTLTNALIECSTQAAILNNAISGLTIVLNGTNYIAYTGEAVSTPAINIRAKSTLTTTEAGSVTYVSGVGAAIFVETTTAIIDGNGSQLTLNLAGEKYGMQGQGSEEYTVNLEINNAAVNIAPSTNGAIYKFHSATLTDVTIYPSNFQFSETERALVDENESVVKDMVAICGSEVSTITYIAEERISIDSTLIFGFIEHTFADGMGTINYAGTLKVIEDYAFTYCETVSYFSLPNTIVAIGEDAFEDCTNLAAITLPEGLKYLGAYAFAYCTSLVTLVLPESLETIEDYAFDGCSSLATMIIPNNVTSIGYEAFYQCTGLFTVTIGSGVEIIEDLAFSACSSLGSIVCRATVPPICESSDVFNEVDRTIPLYVPAENIADYQAADVWMEFFNILPLQDSGVENIDGDSDSMNASYTKQIRNGQLLIIRGNQTYNAQGALLY